MTIDDLQLKQAMRAALVEGLNEQTEFFEEIIEEVVEDIALWRAIGQGMPSPIISREDILRAFEE